MSIQRLFAEDPDFVDNRVRPTRCIYKFAATIGGWWSTMNLTIWT
jgi:hypothetical protein